MAADEDLPGRLLAALPFVRHVGIDFVEVSSGSALARLDERPQIANHIGTVHAAAIFALGEAASGAAVTGAFIDIIAAVRPVAARAEIEFLRLARAPLEAQARIGEPSEALRMRFETERRAEFVVEVDIRDSRGKSVASMNVAWHVRAA
jgi:acyl-coenzyme A thioesterase PaaI-like protein